MNPSTPVQSQSRTIGEAADDVNDWDVLCGRGRQIHVHIGNIHFRKLVIARSQLYKEQADDKARRRAIAFEVVGIVQSKGGRFLKRSKAIDDGSCWEVVPLSVALTKVKQALRDSVGYAEVASKTPSKQTDEPAAKGQVKSLNHESGTRSSVGTSGRALSTSLEETLIARNHSSQLVKQARLRVIAQERIRSALLLQRAQQARRLEQLTRIQLQAQGAVRPSLEQALSLAPYPQFLGTIGGTNTISNSYLAHAVSSTLPTSSSSVHPISNDDLVAYLRQGNTNVRRSLADASSSLGALPPRDGR